MNSLATVQRTIYFTSQQIIYTFVAFKPESLKKCTRCKFYKQYHEFNKDNYRNDGYSNKCRACIRQYVGSKWDKSHYQADPFTGHRTKWGGNRMDAVKGKIGEKWICQSCRNDVPEQISPYLFEYPEKEYIRVCAICINNGCEALMIRIR